MIDKLESTCQCGKPVKYTSPCRKGSCNKYKRCPTYEELLEQNKLNERYLRAYRTFVNGVDDYFEYRNESEKDRQKVHQLLQNLTDRLVNLEEE
jgi:hypothetical protein